MLKKLFGQKKTFRFRESENTACIVCNHVLENGQDILFVSHDQDDASWQFLCGRPDHSEENIRLISLRQLTEIDPSVNDLYEMPLGVCAEREKKGAPWKAFKMEE